MRHNWGLLVIVTACILVLLFSVEEVISKKNERNLIIERHKPVGNTYSSKGNKFRKDILRRPHREAETSYEEGVEYEYEEEEEEATTSSTAKPEVERKQRPEISPNKTVPGEEEADEYYESYDENEENGEHEAEREREREQEAEEEREEEERMAERRREEERREEEDRLEEERREKVRKEEEERQKEEDRLEEEERLAEQKRQEEEYKMLEERRKEDQRRQMAEYESSYEEGDETGVSVPGQEIGQEEKTPSEASTTQNPDDTKSEEVEKSEPTDENTEKYLVTTAEPIPIQETGRHDLERYAVVDQTPNHIPDNEARSEEEYEETMEQEEPTTEGPIIEENGGIQEYDDKLVEEVNTETSDLNIYTTPTPFLPTSPPLDSIVPGTSSPVEYEESSSVEEEEEEIQTSTTEPTETASPKQVNDVVEIDVNERERYHHQDLEIQEEDEDDTELYEGRRFNENSRIEKTNPIPGYIEETHPMENEIQVTGQSGETEQISNEKEVNGESRNIDMNENSMSTFQEKFPVRTTNEPQIVDADLNKPNTKYDENENTLDSSSSESVENENNVVELEPDKKVTDSVYIDYYPTQPVVTTAPVHIEFIESGKVNQHHGRIEDTMAEKIECFPGYELSPDGSECSDIDECKEHVCGSTQICLNLPGSYRCTCDPGFIKDFRDEKICRDLNECEFGNGGCSQDCVNTPGSFYCSCSEPFVLAPNGRSCLSKPRNIYTTTTTSTTTTTTTSTTPRTTPSPPDFEKSRHDYSPAKPYLVSTKEELESTVKYCPTPPVPQGAGIAYLYCSRSPVGIHHRHSPYNQRLFQDWPGKGNHNNSTRGPNWQYRHRRNLKRGQSQTSYSPGSMCELRCRGGFELKGQYTLTCNASLGIWQGTTTGFCQNTPELEKQSHVFPRVHGAETTPSTKDSAVLPKQTAVFQNPTPFPDNNRYHPTIRPVEPIPSTSFRPIFYPPPPAATFPTSRTITPPPSSRFSDNTDAQNYWSRPKYPTTVTTTTTPALITRPYYNYYSPVTYRPITFPNRGVTNRIPSTTSRNSYIQLSYRFKTPWIKCPDDILIDLQPNQNLAYVIVPQPQTNVDWWRQVTSDPSWAKGLETEIGPGKQRITFHARTSAPVNNTADCSFTLEVRDNEPPRVRECPESFTVKLNPSQNAKAVTWNEPHFSDNVRISSLKKSHEPGTTMMAGEHFINYEAKDSSGNGAKCSFTVTVLPPPVQNNYFKPVNTEGINTSVRPEIHSSMRNVVCHVGKKGRRIVFQSRVVPRGCSEVKVDLMGDVSPGAINTLNTVTQNSAENSVTSQISSVSFSSNDNPQSASAFSQAVSNGRNANRMVHSSSSVTNGAHGTNSKSSSYAIAVSASSRNFDLPFFPDKQVYEEDFIVPTTSDFIPANSKTRSGKWNRVSLNGGARNDENRNLRQNIHNNERGPTGTLQNKKYFRHFDSWDGNAVSQES